MRHSILTIYLAAVMLMVKQPWNFWLIFIGIAWARRSPDWASRWKFGPPLRTTPLGELYASRQRSVGRGHAPPGDARSLDLAPTRADSKPYAHGKWRLATRSSW